jgi:hypothetical protein
MDYAQIDSTYYCGIDLHARSMYACIMDRTGTILTGGAPAVRPEKTSGKGIVQAELFFLDRGPFMGVS